MAEAPRYTLDTSAVVAYFVDEPGAAQVERLLALAGAGKAVLRALPVRRLDVTEGLLLRAGKVKATHDLSVADAWVAATAVVTGSRLVHKDPGFRPLEGSVPLLELPLRPRQE